MNLSNVVFLLLQIVLQICVSVCKDFIDTDTGIDTDEPTNIIFVMIDDLGYSDLSLYGSEWPTPNFDSFISNSITLSHHYIGYVCSASRSQFLTGRYSFHNGYGVLNVFDVEKLGAIPQNTPTIMEYLKQFSNYKTYGIGKWQLGHATESHLAKNRGFDYFLGFNGGIEDYFTKIRDRIMFGDHYIDFWENLDVSNEYSNGYSTDQYFNKVIDIINTHTETQTQTQTEQTNNPFFIYLGLQANHIPFPTHNDGSDFTQYYQNCVENYQTYFENFDSRIGVCEAVLGIDNGIGRLINHLKQRKSSNNLWENTLIIVTADNGGALDSGSCNYPLRGGKNTFFEGGQRVQTYVGGGKIPNSQRGVTLDGLFSNVDWFPTILSFANLIPSDNKHIKFDLDTEDSVILRLDGYNQYEYIMGGNEMIRDHIVMHLLPTLDSNSNTFLNNGINNYQMEDMQEFAMIFYDNNGHLWKYLDVTESPNPIGDATTNSKWCDLGQIQSDTDSDSDSESESGNDKYSVRFIVDDAYPVTYALYDISNDMREEINYFDDSYSNLLDSNKLNELYYILNEKIEYYINNKEEWEENGSENSEYLFGNFECFTSGFIEADAAKMVASANNAWVPYLDSKSFAQHIEEYCELGNTHPIYQLHTKSIKWPQSINIIDNTQNIEKLNGRVPNVVRNININEKEKEKSFEIIKNNKYESVINQNNQSKGLTFIIVIIPMFVAIILIFLSVGNDVWKWIVSTSIGNGSKMAMDIDGYQQIV